MPSHSARALSSSSGVSSPRSASTRSQMATNAARRAAARSASASRSASSRRRASIAARASASFGVELRRSAARQSRASRRLGQRPPLLGRLVELRIGVGRARRGRDARRAAPAPGRRASATLRAPPCCAASASSISWTRARARLATDLFFARPAMPSSSSRRSASDGGRRRRRARAAVMPASLWSVLAATARSSA